MKVIYNPVTKRFSADKTIKHKVFTFSRNFSKGSYHSHPSGYRDYYDDSYDDD